MQALEGVVMELEDGAHPLLVGIEATADLKTAFDGTSWALLVGSIPRKAGMERGDLLTVNGGIFKPQGQAINDHAAERRARPRGRQPVQHQLPDRPLERARRPRRPLVRDDPPRREPRQDAARARRPACRSREVTNVAIWGNHSATQFPDFAQRADRRQAGARGHHRHALARRATFIETVQKRGAAVIEKRGASSAASAAHAAIDSVNSVCTSPPPGDDWHSLAVVQPRRVRRARGPAVRLPGAQRRHVAGRSSRASSTTTSPQGRSGSPPRSSSTSATRSAGSASSRPSLAGWASRSPRHRATARRGSPNSTGSARRGRSEQRVQRRRLRAIALTLLVLNFKFPHLHGSTDQIDRELWDFIRTRTASFLSYGLSVFVIGRYWLAHHRMFRLIRHTDAVLLEINLLALAFVRAPALPDRADGQLRGHDDRDRVLRGHGCRRRASPTLALVARDASRPDRHRRHRVRTAATHWHAASACRSSSWCRSRIAFVA